MHISGIKLKNWRNFLDAEVGDLGKVVYLLGQNASGKSNFLDSMRFLRDLAKPQGLGLQESVKDRGGISKIRCLHAQKNAEVSIEVDLRDENGRSGWNYVLGFNGIDTGIGRGPRFVISKEIVHRISDSGKKTTLLKRPDLDDRKDAARLQQTHLEQRSSSKPFQNLAEFFGEITYYNLVPQLLRYGDDTYGRTHKDDPFGQEFLSRISGTRASTRNYQLERIECALQAIVPQFEDLKFLKDGATGRPHLEIRFKHQGPRGAKQMEDQFSDGTLRLIALFWLLQESGGAPLLFEQPELYLNEEVVRQLARLVDTTRRNRHDDAGKQVFISTHSYALLSNPGIDAKGVVVIVPSDEGSTVRKMNEAEMIAVMSGFSPAQVVFPNVRGVPLGKQIKLDA